MGSLQLACLLPSLSQALIAKYHMPTPQQKWILNTGASRPRGLLLIVPFTISSVQRTKNQRSIKQEGSTV